MNNPSLALKIGQGVAWTSVSAVVVKGIGLVYLLVLLAHLSLYEFGIIELALATVGFLSIFSLGGLQPALIADLVDHHTQKKYVDMRNLISSYLGLRFIMAVFSACVLTLMAWLGSFEAGTTTLLYILALIFLSSPLRSFVVLVTSARQDFVALAWFRMSEDVIKLSLTIVCLMVFAWAPLAVIVAYVVTDYCSTIIFGTILMARNTNYFGGQIISSYIFRPLFVLQKHVRWSVLLGALNLVGYHGKPWVIQLVLGTQAVGLYATAMSLYQSVVSLVPMAAVLEPILPMYRSSKSKIASILNAALRYQLLAVVVMMAVASAVFPLFIGWYVPHYSAVIPLFLCLMVVMLPESAVRIYEVFFNAFQLQKDLFWSNTIRLGMVFIVLPIALLTFGIFGIVVEMLCTALWYMYARYRGVQYHIPGYALSLRTLFQWSDTDTLLLAGVRSRLTQLLRRSA